MAYPVFDNHVHLQRNGRYLDAVKEFKRKGGTAFMLVALPPETGLQSGDYFAGMYEAGASIRNEAAEASGLDILLAVGPYPVTLIHLAEMIGLQEAEERMIEGAELAGKMVTEGKANAIGEVGRPHFEAGPDIMEASNRIMRACMQVAKSAGCAVILHTEDPTAERLKEISGMAAAEGIATGNVIKHHCTDLVTDEETSGIFPSVKATKELVFSSARKSRRFVMETDYLDDLARPGAVLGIGTVPRRTRELIDSGIATEDDIWKINYENPARLYGSDSFRKNAEVI